MLLYCHVAALLCYSVLYCDCVVVGIPLVFENWICIGFNCVVLTCVVLTCVVLKCVVLKCIVLKYIELW